MTADDLDAVVSCLADALGPATGRDWVITPGTGEWNCRQTAEHLGDCLLSYAAQLVARPDARYVRFLAVADEEASPAEVLEFWATNRASLPGHERGASIPCARWLWGVCKYYQHMIESPPTTPN